MMITQYALRNKYLTPLLLTVLCMNCALSIAVHAEAVHIPDPNLRAAIRDTLSLSDDAPLTQDHMLKLTRIGYKLRGISNLAGLEHATNLESLAMHVNEIADIRPLAGLTKLFHLNLRNNEIVDISPIANLTALKDLRLRNNRIVDLTHLANLRRLEHLGLHNNHVIDLAPIANLQRLKYLDVSRNPAFDYTSLDALTLDYFIYDQTCSVPPLDVWDRIENRTYPSLFSAWTGKRVLNRPDLSALEKEASHDLWWSVWFGLRMKITPVGRLMTGNIDEAIRSRDEYLAHNPNMVFLTAVKLLTMPSVWFPPEWPHWINYNPNANYNTVNFTHPEVQDVVVDQALAVAGCGLLDGIFIDHWNEEIHYLKGHGPSLEDEITARINILRRIRAQAHPDFLIIGNTKRHKIPRSAPFMNGTFLETTAPCLNFPHTTEWKMSDTESTLLWASDNLREPRINALEGCALTTEAPDSGTNRQWMRTFTTLSLTHSDGYVLFTHGPTHAHYWYDFWDADLGRPVGEKGQLYQETDGLYMREFTNGWAVYNHSGEAQVVNLPEETQGVSSNWIGTTHVLPNLDGEMYLRVKPENPADVNGDGVVNIFDLTLVAQGFGTDNPDADVNGDGVVNVFDLVFVANQF